MMDFPFKILPLNQAKIKASKGSRPIIHYGRILLGEISPLLSAMKKVSPRWSSHQQTTESDPLVKQLRDLQMTILHLKPDATLEPNVFLDPFLAIIRSEDTTGPITKDSLAAVNRMLCYGLLNSDSKNAANAVESIAAAVTHARFVGTDQGADEVVLWEILTVLRTLMLGPVGHLLTNESVCEILNSSFRICFETRLSELLRNCTEDAMRHMIQLLFSRLPQFKDDPHTQSQSRKLKMRAGTNTEVRGKKNKPRLIRPSPPHTPDIIEHSIDEISNKPIKDASDKPPVHEVSDNPLNETEHSCVSEETVPAEDNKQMHKYERVSIDTDENGLVSNDDISVSNKESVPLSMSQGDHTNLVSSNAKQIQVGDAISDDSGILENNLTSSPGSLDLSHTHLAPENMGSRESLHVPVSEVSGASVSAQNLSDSEQMEHIENEVLIKSIDIENKSFQPSSQITKEDFTNSQGVTFTQGTMLTSENGLTPYGLPCIREVLRFLISLILPTNDQNSTHMIHTALNLLTVALEVGAEYMNHTPSLLTLVKDQLCRNLYMILKVDVRPPIFMASLRVCTLLFESLRTHLKFQLEMFINKLTDIISSEAPNVSYFYKEHCLETIVQLWRMPGLIAELFINFDCNIYSSNIFEDLTKMLSKNAFPVQGLYSTNLLSLEALLTVIEIIDSHTPINPKSTKYSVTNPEMSSVPYVMAPASSGLLLGLGYLGGFAPVTPILKAKSCLTDNKEVIREQLLAVKEKKKLLTTGTDQFNIKAEKGISFLQNTGIMGTTNEDIAHFLKENPHLDKKIMGDFLSKKKNVEILSAFVKSFEFGGRRIDECLRAFLETFRLPGEAPLISIVIEHFSSHWHVSNGNPFGKDDAAFTLAYAVIMLNVDQHNQNAKKQNVPMTVDQFRNNLRGVNNGKDFDSRMLEEVYCAIYNEEIVMPAEQTGSLKENYLWKMLLRRGGTKEGEYYLVNNNYKFDRDLFALCWGPTIASLSYVFDKSSEDSFVQNALSGFRKCASIAARYGMSDVFDNLVVSLCKFTTLTISYTESPDNVAISFGGNRKAQLAARTVFQLVPSHADILRDGWKNILELLLQLFRCRLLPSSFVESEDFIEASGKVSLVKEMPAAIPRVESGLFSSLYSYIALGEAASTKGPSPEDIELIKSANHCILSCHPEKLITESAFLRYDSLNELLKAMMGAGDANNMAELGIYSPTSVRSLPKNIQPSNSGLDEYSQSFLLELVVSVLVANKDRAGGIWPSVRDHIYSLLMGAAAMERNFLLERCVAAILRIAKVLLRRPELANPILQSLRMLLLLRSHVLSRVALQIVFGIHEVLSLNADHIQDSNDWAILLALLECAGAGAKPPPIVSPDDQTEQVSDNEGGTSSGPDSGHCTERGSDVETPLTASDPSSTISTEGAPEVEAKISSPNVDPAQNSGGWILVGREGEIEPVAVRSVSVNEWDIVHQRQFGEHKPEALLKAVDTLSFLVRERHITAVSLPSVVQACRTFVEATLHGGKQERKESSKDGVKSPTRKKTFSRKKEPEHRSKSPTQGGSGYDEDESESDDSPQSYQQVSEKLLDLMDTLHTSASHILDLRNQEQQQLHCLHWNQSLSLWQQALCPLLQGIARYCCDIRPLIRSLSMTYLQRALLNHDLQTLNAGEWESCFNKVLFPLLAKLLQPMTNGSSVSLEETRVRAATLVQKVFLRHLMPLLSLPTFTALWLTVLDFMDKYLNTHQSDHLSDAIPEILKNMLLVMKTTQVFQTTEGFTQLWSITWDRIDAFLPDFRRELFRSLPPSEIERIELGPSEPCSPDSKGDKVSVIEKVGHSDQPTLPSPVSGPCEVTTPSLKEQQAVRLSLSQENLPAALDSNVILQPPLPRIFPISSSPPLLNSSPPHEATEVSHQLPPLSAPGQVLTSPEYRPASLLFSPNSSSAEFPVNSTNSPTTIEPPLPSLTFGLSGSFGY